MLIQDSPDRAMIWAMKNKTGATVGPDGASDFDQVVKPVKSTGVEMVNSSRFGCSHTIMAVSSVDELSTQYTAMSGGANV